MKPQKAISRFVKKAPEVTECIRRSVAITGDQQRFLTSEKINLSKLVRSAIDSEKETLETKRKNKGGIK